MTDGRGSPRRERPPGDPKRGHRLAAALLAVPLAAMAQRFGKTARAAPQSAALPDAVSGERRALSVGGRRLSYYVAGLGIPSETPLLLIHSINAAGSAYEMRPLYERLKTSRPVYAIDLPGYGFSERAAVLYTPRLMTDAILAMTDEIRKRFGEGPIDAMALSLSCEFLARAAVEQPDRYRTIALISPTGFDKRGPRNGPSGSNRGMPRLHRAVTRDIWRRPLFNLLTSRVSIRYFLEKTWGAKAIDEGLFDYDYRTTHQPNAEHAPYSFISGFLFSNDISRVYAEVGVPVFMLHGTRGDFVDYSGKVTVEHLANWTIAVLETGALPQFEQLDTLLARYQLFLTAPASLGAPRRDRPPPDPHARPATA